MESCYVHIPLGKKMEYKQKLNTALLQDRRLDSLLRYAAQHPVAGEECDGPNN